MAKEAHSKEIKFRKSIISQLPALTLFAIVTAAAIHLTLKYPWSVADVSFKFSDTFRMSFPVPGFALIPLFLGVRIIHSLFDAKYVIAEDYVRSIHGLLSLKKHDVRLEYQDLRGVEIERNIYGRIVNIGDLKIWSLMPTEVELLFAGVRNPSYYRDEIMERKKGHELKL